MSSTTDYDIHLVRCDYLAGEITLERFEETVGEILNGRRIHEHEWVDITAFGTPVTRLLCAKCGQEKA